MYANVYFILLVVFFLALFSRRQKYGRRKFTRSGGRACLKYIAVNCNDGKYCNVDA